MNTTKVMPRPFAIVFKSRSLADTVYLATILGTYLKKGDAVLLTGSLGAGKTEFSRALIRSFCGDFTINVPSPTFSLLQVYDGDNAQIYHYDLWRLEGPGDLEELNWDEARDEIVLVEWPDRLKDRMPLGALTIYIELVGENMRHFILSGWPSTRYPPSLLL